MSTPRKCPICGAGRLQAPMRHCISFTDGQGNPVQVSDAEWRTVRVRRHKDGRIIVSAELEIGSAHQVVVSLVVETP